MNMWIDKFRDRVPEKYRGVLSVLLWLGLAGGLWLMIQAQKTAPLTKEVGKWVRLDKCELVDRRANDGDSFHVVYNREEYIFRLYFVDTPETDERFPDRLDDQAAVFGVGRQRILELGDEAKVFTKEVLKKPFVVWTRWQDALGSSLQPRFFAFVQTHDGKDLSEALIGQGLARIHGVQAHHPEGATTADIRNRLYKAKTQARAAHLGGWSETL